MRTGVSLGGDNSDDGLNGPDRSGDDGQGEGDADESAGGENAGSADQKRGRRRSAVTEMVLLVVIALTIALVIKTFVVQPFYIPSVSMENTILPRDRVLVNKLVYHLRPIERGDIVVFSGAGSWDGPSARTQSHPNFLVRIYDDSLGQLIGSVESLLGSVPEQTDYIKRVIGLPGDHVICCNARGEITVNGVALDERSYLMTGASPSQEPFDVVVPPGRLWVMGDNRTISEDSRFHDCAYQMADKCHPWDTDGTVGESAVIGRAFMIVWPPSRVKTLSIPSVFGQPGLHEAASAGRAATLAAGFAVAIPLTVAVRRRRIRATGRIRATRRMRATWRILAARADAGRADAGGADGARGARWRSDGNGFRRRAVGCAASNQVGSSQVGSSQVGSSQVGVRSGRALRSD